jgi:hypothetical protein
MDPHPPDRDAPSHRVALVPKRTRAHGPGDARCVLRLRGAKRRHVASLHGRALSAHRLASAPRRRGASQASRNRQLEGRQLEGRQLEGRQLEGRGRA